MKEKYMKKNNQIDPEIISSLEFHTKLSKEQRKKLINWFNKQNVEFQIMIFEEQRNQYFKLKNEATIDKNILSIASFLLAIKHFHDKEQFVRSKNRNQSLNEIGNISKIERIKFKKEKYNFKLQKLLSYHSVIKQLHDDCFSLRGIQDYLLTKHKFDVSHTLISKYVKKHIGY